MDGERRNSSGGAGRVGSGSPIPQGACARQGLHSCIVDITFACTLPIFCSFLAFQVHPGSHLPQWRGVSCEHMTKMGNSVSLRTEIPAPIALRWPRFRAVFQLEVGLSVGEGVGNMSVWQRVTTKWADHTHVSTTNQTEHGRDGRSNEFTHARFQYIQRAWSSEQSFPASARWQSLGDGQG